MSGGDGAKVQPVLGTLVMANGLQLRATVRCLREDVGVEAPLPFLHLLDGPIGVTIQGGPSARAEVTDLTRPAATLGQGAARLLLHPAPEDSIVWIVAYGSGVDRADALDRSGKLWPAPEDRAWLAADDRAMRTRIVTINGPLALAEARAHPGEPCEIAGLHEDDVVSVAVHPGTGDTYVGISLPHRDGLTAECARREIAVVLTSVHADAEWTIVTDELEADAFAVVAGAGAGATTLRPTFLLFRRVGSDDGAHEAVDWGAPRRLQPRAFQLKNLAGMRRALEDHATVCHDIPLAFLLHPVDAMAIGVDELWGIPVTPDASISVKRFALQCLGDPDRTEQALEAFLDETTRPLD